jgi:hypothetical protein
LGAVKSDFNALIEVGCSPMKRLISYPLESGGYVVIEVEEGAGAR